VSPDKELKLQLDRLAARIQELEAGLRSIRGITRTAVARMKAPSSMKCIEDNCTLLLGDEPLDGVTS